MARNLIKENQELKQRLAELEAKEVSVEPKKSEYDDLPPEQDGRQEMVTIYYGPNAQNMREETMPLQKAFDTLVGFYSQFEKPTDRNVPKSIYRDAFGKEKQANQVTCLIKKVYRDARSGQEMTTYRDVPLWLAVDDAVQKGHDVRLITKKEYSEFYESLRQADIRNSKEYREKQRQALVEQMAKEI